MGKDLKIFLLAVGLPALVIACAGICLIRYEMKRANARQEERVREWEAHVATWKAAEAAADQLDQEWQRQVEEWQRQFEQLEQERQRQRDEWMRQRDDRQKRGAAGTLPARSAQTNLPPAGAIHPAASRRMRTGWWGITPGNRPVRAFHQRFRPSPPAEQAASRRILGLFPHDLFSPEESAATERILWIGGCMLGLLFLSFGAGVVLLLRSVRLAREEALKKTDFLSNISHEFKTPLTTICLCAELAQTEGLPDDRRRRSLAAIRTEADRLKGLVLNALDFSRLEKHRREYRLESLDLTALIAAAAQPLAERFAAHGLTLPTEPVIGVTDEAAFKQIIVILLDNAAKYAAAAGPVEVACATVRRHIQVTVADVGPGLDADGLRHAFDRFWRGDNATTAETGGSGLGLAIARALARGMGGDLTVSPRPAGGLLFTLRLHAG